MPKDLEAILQYIDQPKTDYAYMITGSWGSGKTYFWKHVVVPKLREVPHGQDAPLIAYVSLYGIKRPEEVRNIILAQLNPKMDALGQWTNVLGPSLLRWMKIEVPDHASFINWVLSLGKKKHAARHAFDWLFERLNSGRKMIICFDDLERTDMQIDVALGQINQYVEHTSTKVVILCNEDQIREADKKTYEKTKEKVVRITRHLTLDRVNILVAVCAEFSVDKAYHNYLTTNQHLLFELARQSDFKNIRSLKYAFLMLQTAFNVAVAIVPHDEQYHRLLMVTVFPAAIDKQEGKISEKDTQSFLTHGNNAIMGAYMGKRDGKPAPLANFGDRYGFGGFELSTLISPALAELVTTGYLDSQKLEAEITSRNAAELPGQKAVKDLKNGWFQLDDATIGETVQYTLDTIRNGEIADWDSLMILANTLEWMGKEHIHGIGDDSLKNVFIEGIGMLASQGRFEQKNPHIAKHDHFQNILVGKLRQDVHELLVKTNQSLIDEQLRVEIVKSFGKLRFDNDEFVIKMWDTQEHRFGDQPMVGFISSHEFFDMLTSVSNAMRHEIAMAFRYRYKEQYNLLKLVEDIPWLKDLSKRMDEYLATSNAALTVKNYNLRQVKDYVDSAVVALEPVV